MNTMSQEKPTQMLAPTDQALVGREMFNGYPDLLTPSHIAEITGLTAQYVRTLCRKGKLPAVQIGDTRWYVPKARFIAFVMGGSRG